MAVGIGSWRPGRASVRREMGITAPPDDVWALMGDPARIHEWFPGIVDCRVEGTRRTVTTGSGIPLPEDILTVDPLARRFQYRLAAPMIREHLGTIDVLDGGDGTSLVVYSTDAEPATMALVIGGATGNALRNVKRMLEQGPEEG